MVVEQIQKYKNNFQKRDFWKVRAVFIECCKTKIKAAITPTNHKNVNNTKGQSQFDTKTQSQQQVREKGV